VTTCSKVRPRVLSCKTRAVVFICREYLWLQFKPRWRLKNVLFPLSWLFVSLSSGCTHLAFCSADFKSYCLTRQLLNASLFSYFLRYNCFSKLTLILFAPWRYARCTSVVVMRFWAVARVRPAAARRCVMTCRYVTKSASDQLGARDLKSSLIGHENVRYTDVISHLFLQRLVCQAHNSVALFISRACN